MNVALPESQHAIATGCQVRRAGTVALDVGGLNRKARVGVQGRVAVPEVAVPLNDEVRIRDQDINNKLAVDDVLVHVLNAQTVEDGASCALQAVDSIASREVQHTLDPQLIVAEVPAGPVAVRMTGRQPVADSVERCAARPASDDATCTSLSDFLLSVVLDSLWRSLPCIRTFDGAERRLFDSVGDKPRLTPSAYDRPARVAKSSDIGSREERGSASLAWFRLVGNVPVHTMIIPLRIAP